MFVSVYNVVSVIKVNVFVLKALLKCCTFARFEKFCLNSGVVYFNLSLFVMSVFGYVKVVSVGIFMVIVEVINVFFLLLLFVFDEDDEDVWLVVIICFMCVFFCVIMCFGLMCDCV